MTISDLLGKKNVPEVEVQVLTEAQRRGNKERRKSEGGLAAAAVTAAVTVIVAAQTDPVPAGPPVSSGATGAVRRKEGKTKNAAGERMCTLVRSRPGVRRKEGKTKNAAGECTDMYSR